VPESTADCTGNLNMVYAFQGDLIVQATQVPSSRVWRVARDHHASTPCAELAREHARAFCSTMACARCSAMRGQHQAAARSVRLACAAHWRGKVRALVRPVEGVVRMTTAKLVCGATSHRETTHPTTWGQPRC